MSFIEVSGIRKAFGEGLTKVDVLRGIDFSLEKRRVLRFARPIGFG